MIAMTDFSLFSFSFQGVISLALADMHGIAEQVTFKYGGKWVYANQTLAECGIENGTYMTA
jgi:hypothetical protein